MLRSDYCSFRWYNTDIMLMHGRRSNRMAMVLISDFDFWMPDAYFHIGIRYVFCFFWRAQKWWQKPPNLKQIKRYV